MQYAFTSEDGSVLECEFGFADADFANLNFLDQPRQDVLLHLSFRHGRQVLVQNRHIDGAWAGATTLPVALHRSGNTLRVTFHGDHAVVHVNGTKAGRFDLPESLLGGPEPAHWVRVVGEVSGLRLSGPAHERRAGRGVIALARPFVLEGWAFDPAAEEQRITVTVGADEDTLPLATLADAERAREQRAPTERVGVRGIVPGWIWDGVPDTQAEVTLQLRANGRPCGAPLALHRSDIARMVEEVCARGESASEFELLSALEHDRFAGLGPRLTGRARSALAAAAERLGAVSFHLPAVEAAHAPAAAAKAGPVAAGKAPPVAAEEAGAAAQALAGLDPVPRALRRISPVLGLAAPAQWADLIRADGLEDLDPARLRDLLLVMASNFCKADRFEDLRGLCAEYEMDDMPVSFGNWATALTQPFLYVEGRGIDMHASLRSIVEFNGWVDHNALCWAVRRVLRERPAFVAEHHREDIAAAIVSHVERHRGKAHSAPMAALFATLLAEADTFSDEFRDTLAARVLSLYGLSARFWAAVDGECAGGRLALCPALAADRARFAEIEAAISAGDPARARDAVRGSTAAEAHRLSRELALAMRAGGGAAGDVLARATADLWRGSDEEEDALLRHLAYPGAETDLPEHADRARRVIRRRHANVPRALHPDQQLAAGAAARRLLTTEAGTGMQEDLDAFCAAAQACGSWRDDYLGAGLLVALMSGAQVRGDDALAAAVEGRLETLLRGYGEGERDMMSGAPALRMALWGLRRTQELRPGAAGARTLERFDTIVSELPPGVAAALSPRTGLAAFHDVLVVVYSCRPYLESRLPAMRAAWLDDLEAAGIPWIVAVGGGDGTLDGHVLSLEAPDSYEALPQKSVALFEWLRANSGFAHVYKIDDDCFLDAERAIGGLSYRRYDYFGRRLTLRPGQMDRLWHQGRSAAPTAAREIDKSPEPSEYADGGAGYVLNRRALEALHEVWQSPEGAWLRLVSFMEDKLVGDSLARAGVRLSHRDYHACILRRSPGKGPAVSRWEHGFLPSAATPTMVAHLDDAALQATAAERRRGAALTPRRIWPTSHTVQVGQGDVCLDLVSPQERLDRVNAAPVCVVACMRNEMQMLPMFLEHYRKLGVGGFLVVDNVSDDGTLAYLAEQEDVAAFSSDAPYSKTEYGVVWQRALIANFRLGRWSLVADCDEFLVLPDGATRLPDLLAGEDFAEADAARAFMLDMYPEGPLAEATLASGDPFAELTQCERVPFLNAWNPGPYANDETWTSALRHRLLPGSRRELFVAQKYALMRYRPWMRFTAGLHYGSDLRPARRDLVFAHFKYHAGFHERVRIETERREHFNDAEEYRKYLALLSEGRDVIHDPSVSVPWRESPWVRSVLSGAAATADARVSAAVPAQ